MIIYKSFPEAGKASQTLFLPVFSFARAKDKRHSAQGKWIHRPSFGPKWGSGGICSCMQAPTSRLSRDWSSRVIRSQEPCIFFWFNKLDYELRAWRLSPGGLSAAWPILLEPTGGVQARKVDSLTLVSISPVISCIIE